MWSDLLIRVRALVRPKSVERELDEELRFHFESQVEKYETAGMTKEEARRRARLEFGGAEGVKEECREARGVHFVETILQDVRYGLRMLGKSLGFTAIAVVTLALGIGINTAIFSVLEAQIWAPLPFPDSNRLLFVGAYDAKRPDRTYMLSAADFQDWLTASQNSFAEVCAFQGSDYHTAPGAETAEMVTARPVSASFFQTLRMPPIVGRAFLPEEQQSGGDHEVILSFAYWENHYGSDSAIIGHSLTLDGTPYRIVGVAPKGLRFEFFGDPDMYVPLVFAHKNILSRTGTGLMIVARQKTGVPLAIAQAQMDVVARQLAAQSPERDANRGIKIERLIDAFGGPHQGLFFFAGAAGLVLLIACANVASLLLARGLARQHEFGIRSALGASRAALLRQLLVEGALLGVLGGGLGIFASVWGGHALNLLMPRDFLSRDVVPQVDVRVLAFAILISLVTAIFAALAPGLFASRVDLTGALQAGARGLTGAAGHHRLRNALVITEVTMAVTLLSGAGLFLDSFVRQIRAPLGFNPHHLVSLGLTFSDKRYLQPQNLLLAEEQILERVRGVPGILDAGLASQIPFAGGISADFSVAGQPFPQNGERRHNAIFSSVTSDYFRLLKIPFLAGRPFGGGDFQSSPTVAIVNENFVHHYLAGRNPIGTELDIFDEDASDRKFRVRIVGIVQNTHMFGPNEVPFDFIYAPAEQVPLTSFNSSVFVIASTDLPLGSVLAPIRHQIAQVDGTIPVTHAATMDERAAGALRGARNDLILIGAFAGLAILLVAVGIFGAINFYVQQRTREIGIRVALGASPSRILLQTLKRSAVLCGSGLLLGVGVSLLLGRLLGSALFLVPTKHDGLLYGVSLFDPLTLSAACVLLTFVLLLASYIPARRATQVDPMVTLRQE
jgi:putative ABC transport system permease protein